MSKDFEPPIIGMEVKVITRGCPKGDIKVPEAMKPESPLTPNEIFRAYKKLGNPLKR